MLWNQWIVRKYSWIFRKNNPVFAEIKRNLTCYKWKIIFPVPGVDTERAAMRKLAARIPIQRVTPSLKMAIS